MVIKCPLWVLKDVRNSGAIHTLKAAAGFTSVIKRQTTNRKVQYAGTKKGNDSFPLAVFLGVNIQTDIGNAAEEPGEGTDTIGAAT